MATSPETFRQVRDILKKLDRSIETARDRRLSSEQDDQRPTGVAHEPGRPLRAKPMRTHAPGDPWVGPHG